MNNLCKNILFGKAGSQQTGIDGSITLDFAFLGFAGYQFVDNEARRAE
jgi:hypothetical protein